LWRISEPSRRDNERVFLSRSPTELKDLSPTVHSLNNWVARLWPLADLKERENSLSTSLQVCVVAGFDATPGTGSPLLRRYLLTTHFGGRSFQMSYVPTFSVVV